MKAHNSYLPVFGAFIFTALTACGGGGGSGGAGEGSGLSESFSGITLNIAEYGDLFTGQPYVLRYSYGTGSADTESGTADIDDLIDIRAGIGEITRFHPVTGKKAQNGTVYYYIPESVLNGLDNFFGFTEKFTVSGIGEVPVTFSVDLGASAPHGDPLFAEQWHLKNTGQNPFGVKLSPLDGIDLNVVPAWHQTDADDNPITGRNVKVAVLDTNIDFEHEDLKDRRYNPKTPAYYINQGVSLTDALNDEVILHGTKVAGIIGATANNGLGVRGIAFESKLTSYHKDNTIVSRLTDASEVNVINASISLDNSYSYRPNLEAYFVAMFENNIPFIRAAGNEFSRVTFSHGDYYPLNCVSIKSPCQFNQTSSLNRGRYVILAGALNSLGKKSSYSSPGANIWVTGAGGEFGYNGSANSSAAVVTTKFSHDPSEYNDLKDKNTPWRTDAANYNNRRYYTHAMNGTSSGAPSVTGVAALVKQAKPDLTVPQLRYILAMTANNDRTPGWQSLDYSPVKSKVAVYGNSQITHDYGWITNSAGLRFSNYYGFGTVNAAGAVSMALSCDSNAGCAERSVLPTDYESTGTAPCTSDNGGRDVTCSFSGFTAVDDESDTRSVIEIEDLGINMSSFMYADDINSSFCHDAYRSDRFGIAYANSLLQIEMTSADGTKALIKPVYSNWDYNAKAMINEGRMPYRGGSFMIYSSAFYTEKVAASDTVTVKFKSVCPIDVTTLNREIRIVIGGYPY